MYKLVFMEESYGNRCESDYLRQKLTIAKGLCDYQYIIGNWQTKDADFQAVYYEF